MQLSTLQHRNVDIKTVKFLTTILKATQLTMPTLLPLVVLMALQLLSTIIFTMVAQVYILQMHKVLSTLKTIHLKM